jgi:hypothetical protein
MFSLLLFLLSNSILLLTRFRQDELRLWPDALWINDRVYNQAGELLIGNTEGVPYKMQQIAPGQ